MTRDELNDVAGERGIADAASYPNKAELIAVIEAAAEPDDDASDLAAENADAEYQADTADAGPEKSGKRYTVLKAITVEDGKTYMPGEEFVPGPDFPSRRPKQLVDQKFLRPLE